MTERPAMTRKRLIFFASADPRTDPKPTGQAYHFATVAARAGLDAEVRLAGDAVRIAQPGGVAATPEGEALQEKAHQATDNPYLVSLCPSCVTTREVSQDQIDSIGGVQRPLADILTEVAEGRSELIYVG